MEKLQILSIQTTIEISVQRIHGAMEFQISTNFTLFLWNFEFEKKNFIIEVTSRRNLLIDRVKNLRFFNVVNFFL